MPNRDTDPPFGRRRATGAEAALIAAGDLGRRQRAFAEALLDPACPIPPGLVGPDGEPSAKRFAVYRNNVVAGLIEALKHAFPVVHRLVGDAFFSAMARHCVARDLPTSPIMLDYGSGFAGFIGGFEPAASLPYLPDVARLERAWIEAHHAAEATPVDPLRFRTVAPDQLATLSLTLHPSVRVVRSSFPAVSIWRMNTEEDLPGAIDLGSGGEDALVARPDAEVEVRLLPIGAAIFIDTLAAGAPVIDATEAALAAAPRFDLAGALAGLLSAGVIVGWSLCQEAPGDPPRRST